MKWDWDSQKYQGISKTTMPKIDSFPIAQSSISTQQFQTLFKSSKRIIRELWKQLTPSKTLWTLFSIQHFMLTKRWGKWLLNRNLSLICRLNARGLLLSWIMGQYTKELKIEKTSMKVLVLEDGKTGPYMPECGWIQKPMGKASFCMPSEIVTLVIGKLTNRQGLEFMFTSMVQNI